MHGDACIFVELRILAFQMKIRSRDICTFQANVTDRYVQYEELAGRRLFLSDTFYRRLLRDIVDGVLKTNGTLTRADALRRKPRKRARTPAESR